MARTIDLYRDYTLPEVELCLLTSDGDEDGNYEVKVILDTPDGEFSTSICRNYSDRYKLTGIYDVVSQWNLVLGSKGRELVKFKDEYYSGDGSLNQNLLAEMDEYAVWSSISELGYYFFVSYRSDEE